MTEIKREKKKQILELNRGKGNLINKCIVLNKSFILVNFLKSDLFVFWYHLVGNYDREL